MEIDPQQLAQRWLHSHEEDSDTEMVFRPADYDFGPSRGRMGLELKPDHSCTNIGIAPTDGPIESQAVWEVDDDQNLIIYGSSGSPSQVFQIVSLQKDRLVVKRLVPDTTNPI